MSRGNILLANYVLVWSEARVRERGSRVSQLGGRSNRLTIRIMPGDGATPARVEEMPSTSTVHMSLLASTEGSCRCDRIARQLAVCRLGTSNDQATLVALLTATLSLVS
jgi:hypothetical protein